MKPPYQNRRQLGMNLLQTPRRLTSPPIITSPKPASRIVSKQKTFSQIWLIRRCQVVILNNPLMQTYGRCLWVWIKAHHQVWICQVWVWVVLEGRIQWWRCCNKWWLVVVVCQVWRARGCKCLQVWKVWWVLWECPRNNKAMIGEVGGEFYIRCALSFWDYGLWNLQNGAFRGAHYKGRSRRILIWTRNRYW